MWHQPLVNAIRGFNDAASLFPAAILRLHGTRQFLIYNALPLAGTRAWLSFRWSRILQHDQEPSSIFTGGTLTVIFVAVVAVVFYTFARNLHHFTTTVHDREYEVHEVDEVPQAEPHATSMSGPQVFNEACIVCHGNGIGGAPMLNDRAVWEPRIAQGKETLYRHAIEGYTGSAGYMPPKGARLDLSDAEVKEAVEYMLSQLPN